MNNTKSEVLKKLDENDAEWFGKFVSAYPSDKHQINQLYYADGGDGRLVEVVLEFIFEDESLIVKLEGTYSSWDDSSWDDVYLAKPYVFTETRYERA